MLTTPHRRLDVNMTDGPLAPVLWELFLAWRYWKLSQLSILCLLLLINKWSGFDSSSDDFLSWSELANTLVHAC